MKIARSIKEIVPAWRPKPTNWFVYIPWSNRSWKNTSWLKSPKIIWFWRCFGTNWHEWMEKFAIV
jgi:hypothetical protein